MISGEGGMLFDPNQTTVRWFRSIFNPIMFDIVPNGYQTSLGTETLTIIVGSNSVDFAM
jgi:hypothetical protein